MGASGKLHDGENVREKEASGTRHGGVGDGNGEPGKPHGGGPTSGNSHRELDENVHGNGTRPSGT